MPARPDLRTLLTMLGALVVGVAWGAYNLASTGGVRNDATVRPLVWTMFSAPAALFLGWLVARRREVGLAAFCCFCLYFFTFFVAQRIETLFFTLEEARANGHTFYFVTALVLHALTGIALAVWRAWQPEPPGEPSAYADAQPPPSSEMHK